MKIPVPTGVTSNLAHFNYLLLILRPHVSSAWQLSARGGHSNTHYRVLIATTRVTDSHALDRMIKARLDSVNVCAAE